MIDKQFYAKDFNNDSFEASLHLKEGTKANSMLNLHA